MSGFYDAKQMAQVAEFFTDLEAAVKKLEGDSISPTDDNPLYVFGGEIIIRHKDDYTLGRFAWDDFLYFKHTAENYGEKPKADAINVGLTIQQHIAQQDTGSGRRSA